MFADLNSNLKYNVSDLERDRLQDELTRLEYVAH